MRACALLIALAMLAGCMAMPPPEPNVATRALDVPPTGTAELDFEMQKGAEIVVSLAAQENVSWDIHSHPEGNVMTWRQGEGNAMNVTFTAPVDDVYSVQIIGGESPAHVDVEMRGAFTMRE